MKAKYIDYWAALGMAVFIYILIYLSHVALQCIYIP